MPLLGTFGAMSLRSAGFGLGPVGPAVPLSIVLDTASNLDAVSVSGYDLLIAKARAAATSWCWRDTTNGTSYQLHSDTNDQLSAFTNYATSLGSGSNNSVLLKLKKQAKFLDIVNFTAGFNANRRISHSLGAAPGMVIMKGNNGSGQDWITYHRSKGINYFTNLNGALDWSALSNAWGTSNPTTSDFGINEQSLCGSGISYTLYLFAHDTDTTNGVIQCGSMTGGSAVTLGWEPQLVLAKYDGTSAGAYLLDQTRGKTKMLQMGTVSSEATLVSPDGMATTSTGFTFPSAQWGSSAMVFLAVRKGA